MARALGIIAFEGNNVRIEGMSNHRTIASVPFLGRYELIDFPISNMSNSGIQNINVHVKEKPRSLFEHIGTGRHYNINSKHGKVRIIYGESQPYSEIYNTDVRSYLDGIKTVVKEDSEYVIICPSHFTYTEDFEKVLNHHIDSKADITMLYKNVKDSSNDFIGCDTLKFVKGRRLVGNDINRGRAKNQNISLECYFMSKFLFIKLIKIAADISPIYWLKDIIFESLESLDIKGYPVRTPVFASLDLQSYFQNNIRAKNAYKSGLFNPKWPVFTRTNDSSPSLYGKHSKVSNSLVANGAVVDGTVVNSIIGRNAVVHERATIVNSIILKDVIIGRNVSTDYVLVDKDASVERSKELFGHEDKIIYVNSGDSI